MSLTVTLLACLMAFQSSGQELGLEDHGLIGVLTFKQGVLKGMAHNHLITAQKYKGSLRWDGSDPMSLRGTVTLRVGNLAVDDPEASMRWYPRIETLGWLQEPYGLVPMKDRNKVRKAMLSKDQLDQKKFPDIKAEIIGAQPADIQVGGVTFNYQLSVTFTVKGTSVTIVTPANLDVVEGGLKIEAVVTTTFSQFGIEPYSAMFGAIANQDTIHVIVAVSARP